MWLKFWSMKKKKKTSAWYFIFPLFDAFNPFEILIIHQSVMTLKQVKKEMFPQHQTYTHVIDKV